MTEITDGLLELFIGKQSVKNVRLYDGSIHFDVCHDTGQKPDSRRIRQSDIEEIQGFFTSPLQSRPFAKHLLQILWIREFKFAMGSLQDDDLYDFIQGAFTFYGIDIDDETVEDELHELLAEGYLEETNAGFSLSSKGECVAEGLFKTMNMLVSAPENVLAKLNSAIFALLEQRLPITPRSAEEKNTKKTRRTVSERRAEIRKAVKHYYENEWDGITQGEVEAKFELGSGALSKNYGKKMMEEYQRNMRNQKKSVSKPVGDDYFFNETR